MLILKNRSLKYGLNSQSVTSENRATTCADKASGHPFKDISVTTARERESEKTIKAVITEKLIITERPVLPEQAQRSE